MNILISILAFLIIFSLIIFIHELGHFLAAKRAGIKVEEFGFGMPPRMWGKKRGDTIYSVNWIPFGGFVRMLGEDLSDPQAKKSKRSYLNKPLRSRILVAIAGVLMNLLLAFFCLTLGFWIGIEPLIVTSEDFVDVVRDGGIVMEVGEHDGGYVVALPRVAVFDVERWSQADEIGFEEGDIVLKINDEEVFTISDYDELTAYGVDQYEVWRDGEAVFLDGEIEEEQAAVVSYVLVGTPAEEIGLQGGDLIL